MLPVIAIIGRPNVGKSTLFNRLTRTRNALISAYPGMTRDRQYGEAQFDDKKFIVIDTGGIEDRQQNEIEQLTKHQAEIAIEDADKILFVIDARDGVLPDDKTIALQLRKTNKPICVVVNKAENADPLVAKSEASELGFESAVAISAEHNQGIDRLVETLFALNKNQSVQTENLEERESAAGTEDDGRIKIAIVGRPNVGKSTLTNRFLGEARVMVHDSPGTTRDSIYIPLDRYDHHYTLIDTAGVRKRKKITDVPEKFSVVKTLQAIENANVVLYVIDARLGVAEQDLKLLGFVLECGKGLVIAINKWDGLSQDERDAAKKTIDRHLDFVPFARVHFISALHGSGVGNLFDSINEAYASATKKLTTPILTRLLNQATEAHQPPLVHGRRIKLRYAHAGGHNPQRIIIHGNQVLDLPGSYKRYLANYFQTKLKLYGTPVYIELKQGKNPYGKSARKKS